MVTSAGAQQLFNSAYHNPGETPFPFVVAFSGNNYFTSISTNAASFGATFLYKYDQFGTRVFRNLINVPFVEEFFRTADNGLLIVGNTLKCDVLDPATFINYVSKYDNAGNMVFTSTLNLSQPGGNIVEYLTAVQHADQSFYVFTETSMHTFSANGSHVANYQLGVGGICSAICLPNGNILVSGLQNNNPVLAELSTFGLIISVYPSATLYRKMIYYGAGTGIIGLSTANTLNKLSAGFQLLSSSNFSNVPVKDFTVNNDSIYVISQGSQNATYFISDISFNVLYQTWTTTQRVEQQAIAKNEAKVSILSRCYSDQSFRADNGFSSLNVINRLSSNNFSHDIGVTKVKLGAIGVSAVTDSSLHSHINTRYKLSASNVTITVRNFGTQRITGFLVNSYLYQHVTCGQEYFQSSHMGLTLDPGDSLDVITGPITREYIAGGAGNYDFNICFYSTLPNGANDKLIGNDGACVVVPVNVGMNELSGQAGVMRIYPNPCTNAFKIESENNIADVTVYNTLGVKVFFAETGQKSVSILTDEFDPGIYYVYIETDSGTSVSRLVKE